MTQRTLRTIHWSATTLIAASAVLCTIVGWRVADQRRIDHLFLKLLMISAVLFALLGFVTFFATLLHHSKVPRNYGALLFICAAIVFYVPSQHAGSRMAYTTTNLEATYDRLAQAGPPFPAKSDEALVRMFRDARMVSSGYWVSEDRQKFKVYYHVDSNSFALAYPQREWSWRGSGYKGPRTSDGATAAR